MGLVAICWSATYQTVAEGTCHSESAKRSGSRSPCLGGPLIGPGDRRSLTIVMTRCRMTVMRR